MFVTSYHTASYHTSYAFCVHSTELNSTGRYGRRCKHVVETKDPADSPLHINGQRDTCRSVSGRLPTEAQQTASTLEMPTTVRFRYHYHRKKNRLLLSTNSDYWLHWIHSKIEDTYLLPYHIIAII